MQFSLSGALNASAEIADAANHPLIRLFTVGQRGSFNDAAPLPEFQSIEQNWAVASPTAVGNGDFSYFSALCYLFARETQAALGEPSKSATRPVAPSPLSQTNPFLKAHPPPQP